MHPATPTLRSLLVLSLGVTVPVAARAQAALLGPGAAFISIGSAKVSTGALDERLAASNYPTFGQKASQAGIGGYRIFRGKMLLGAEITGLDLGDKPHNGNNVWLGGGYATIGIGRVRDLSPRLRSYSRLGLGAGGLTMLIRTFDTATFDNVLANPLPAPNRGRHLSRDGGVFDLGTGLEFLPGRRSRGSEKSGLLVGVRLGYLFTSFGSESDWQLLGSTATGGPSASITGPYLRIVIGGAWSR